MKKNKTIQNAFKKLQEKVIELKKRELIHPALKGKLGATNQEIDHQKKVLFSIQNINRLIVTEHNKQSLINNVCHELTASCGYFSSWIMLLDEKGDFESVYHSGFGKLFSPLFDKLKQNIFTNCAVRTLKQKEIILTSSPLKTCKDCPFSKHYEDRSAMSVCIRYEQKTFGMLTVSISSHFLDEKEDQILLQKIANGLGLALNNIESDDRIKHFSKLVKTLPQPMSVVSSDYRYMAVNDVYANLYNKSKDDMIGQRLYNFIKAGVFNEEIKPRIDRCLAGETIQYEVFIDFEAKGNRWMSMEYHPYHDEHGFILGIISNGFDITKLKMTEEELRAANQQLTASEQQLSASNQQLMASEKQLKTEVHSHRKAKKELQQSEKHFRYIYEHMAVGIVYLSLDFTIQAANQSYCKMLGFEEAELKGKHLKDITHPESLEENCRKLKKLVSGKMEFYHMEKKYVHKDGHTIHGILDTNLIKDPDGKPQYLLGSVLDISKRKKAEDERRGLQYNLEDIIENSPDAIIIADAEGRNKYVNQRFLEITGYTINESLNLTLKDFTPVEDFLKYAQLYNDRLKGRTGPKIYERTIITKQGRIVPVEMRTTTTIWEGEKCGLSFMTDTTERKKIENDMKKALERAKESDNLKSAFLANMSHEIRTPMNGILGFTELLQTPGLSLAEQKKYIDIIKISGDRMLSTVNDIIDISKIECGQMEIFVESVNLTNELELLYKFFKPEAESKGLKFHLLNSLIDKEVQILTDLTKFSSIIINLVKNAIKFTEQGKIEIRNIKKDGYINISVNDTGIGIPEKRKDSIFNRFEQAHIYNQNANQGSGLGLAITKSYVEMLGGKIWFESKEGKGSSFHFRLPI
jgi:PAS domain S-box-containing protein